MDLRVRHNLRFDRHGVLAARRGRSGPDDSRVQQLGLLVGFSQGALESLKLAADHPDRVLGAILIHPAPGLEPDHAVGSVWTPCLYLCRVCRVSRRSGFSAQTLSVLAALCAQPSQWCHGYELAKQTGLKSGTLYPILIRLAGRGLVEARRQDEPQPGRPRRHLYRLTADRLAAADALAGAAKPAALAARTGPGVVARAVPQ